jgi:hypothetical protein
MRLAEWFPTLPMCVSDLNEMRPFPNPLEISFTRAKCIERFIVLLLNNLW